MTYLLIPLSIHSCCVIKIQAVNLPIFSTCLYIWRTKIFAKAFNSNITFPIKILLRLDCMIVAIGDDKKIHTSALGRSPFDQLFSDANMRYKLSSAAYLFIFFVQNFQITDVRICPFLKNCFAISLKMYWPKTFAEINWQAMKKCASNCSRTLAHRSGFSQVNKIFETFNWFPLFSCHFHKIRTISFPTKIPFRKEVCNTRVENFLIICHLNTQWILCVCLGIETNKQTITEKKIL